MIAIAFCAGVFAGYGLAVCCRVMGERSQEIDAVKPEPKPKPRTARVTLHEIEFDDEALAYYAEHGGRN